MSIEQIPAWQVRQWQPIDVVIPWVDGDDPAWRKERARYTPAANADGREERYRDWDNLQYVFRGIETFMPWVNQVHFVTCGHLPKWLNVACPRINTTCPKLHIVRHEDFIPAEFLPTFNANTIELNLHRIPGLAEQFIYFNDDMFPLQPMRPERFFRNGLPCDSALMNPVYTAHLADTAGDTAIYYFSYNDVEYLNRFYDRRESIRRHPCKWFHPAYGIHNLRNICLLPWPRFVGFYDPHLPQPYLKSSFVGAWEEAGDILDATCRNRFRSDRDVNQWYVRYRQLARGEFMPVRPIMNASYQMAADNAAVYEAIRKQKCPMVCINDGGKLGDAFPEEKEKLRQALNAVLPERAACEGNDA